ncbi:phytoene/squalene synthase family protein [Bacillus sp. REN10]|uniref:phytoene/squalene synthase family protein n=1 Tax=Bacillus sp. REN10 TaxID=2782541 RepID=UPI00193B647A|nr:phytoene/squalene synthase family protein [Bacillus sp. REN10]
MLSIKEAYQYCETVIAYHSKTFYKAFSLLPKEDRRAVYAVYAFCRKVDDIVDEGDHPVSELGQFSEEFERFLTGSFDHSQAMWVALHDVFLRYDMDEKPFRDLIKGQKMDLYIHRYETMDQLLNYCYYVASTVGLMLLPILAPKKVSVLREGAIALGLAMQLTNILRDIGEDLERDRIYIPREIMHHYGLTERSLWKRNIDGPFIDMWEHVAEQAERFYQQAFQSMHEYPVAARMPVKGAAYLYREILPTIRSKKYAVFQEKHFVTDEAKKAILAKI